MISRFAIKKQRGRRPLAALATLSIVAGLLISTGIALAVHDEDFQLDGDTLSSTTTSAGGSTQDVDWDLIFGSNGEALSLPTGFSDADLQRDFSSSLGASGGTFITSDTTTFATGSKDTLPISGWQCNFDNNVNSKIDVMNAYAVAYTDGTDEFMYFGLERNTNTGDANVGFWFLQSAVGCDASSGTADFTGEHTDGDVLVVSAFSGGGTVSTINVYRWDGDDATGSLNTTPISSGVDCRANTVLPEDDACAAANTANIEVPWLTANFKDKVGNKLRTAEFFEGGINLSDLNLGGKCFNTFIGDTRSSTSLTATLFDFAAGTVGACEPETTTQASTNGTVIPGTAVTDTATITITGADNPDDPTGDVTFFLCGPIAAGADCATGGTNIGTGTLANQSGGTTTDGIAVATSPEVNTAASVTGNLVAGHYCFRAEWPGDLNYDGSSHTNAVSECFNVADTSSGSTAQRWLPNDSATFSSTGGSNLSGSVQFTMYASANCTGTILYQETRNLIGGSSSETVSTTNGDGAPATGLAADEIFRVADSPVTISWSAVFTSSNPSAVGGSTAPCETSSLTIDDNIDVP